MFERYRSNRDPNANRDESYAVFVLMQRGFVVYEGSPHRMREMYLVAEGRIGEPTNEERIIAVYMYDGGGDLIDCYAERKA